MKKIYLLILTLVLFQGVLFAQYKIGDYQTKDEGTLNYWDFSSTWTQWDGGNWVTATSYPGQSGEISNDVYVIQTVYVVSFITIGSSGKIHIINDDPAAILNIGFYSTPGAISVKGSIEIEAGGGGQLVIENESSLYIEPGGQVTDFSGGNITNYNATGGLVIKSLSSSLNGSLITQSPLKGTYQQFISSDKWHFISSPIALATVGDLWDGSNNAYLREYNSPGDGWGAYLTDISTYLTIGKGYELWLTEDYTPSISGDFNSSTQILGVSTGGSEDTDWNLIGNPYPTGIDWDLIDDKANVVATAFYVLKNGAYEYYDGTAGDASHIIPPFQGFFVKSNGGGNIEINHNDKVHPDVSLYKNSSETTFTNHIRLNAEINGKISSTFSYQKIEATNLQDNFDATMLFSVDESLMDVYTFAGDQQTCINVYGEYPYVMEVGFKVPVDGGDITITASDFRNLDANLVVTLQDKVTDDYIDFLANPSYTFTAMSGDVTDRIFLIMNNNVGIDDLSKDAIQIYSNKNTIYLNFSNQPFNGELKVYNLLGQAVYSSQTSNNLYRPISLNQPSGYYFVELITDNESLTQKVFIQQQ